MDVLGIVIPQFKWFEMLGAILHEAQGAQMTFSELKDGLEERLITSEMILNMGLDLEMTLLGEMVGSVLHFSAVASIIACFL